jgi:hypothetical protein
MRSQEGISFVRIKIRAHVYLCVWFLVRLVHLWCERGGPFWSECIILMWGMLFVCSSNDIPRVTAHIYLPLAPIKSIYLYAPVSRSDHLLFIILIYSQSIIHFLQLSRRRTGVPSRPASALFGIQCMYNIAGHRAPYGISWAHWTADGRTAEKWRRTATKKSATWPMKRGIIYYLAWVEHACAARQIAVEHQLFYCRDVIGKFI